MFPVSLSIGSICLLALVSAVSPAYLVPQQRSESASISLLEQNPTNSVEYQIVPSSEYAVATLQPSELSVMDYVLSPVTAIISLGSAALSVASWIVFNGGLVLLGMAIVIGFCALTPYCTLIIEKPSFLSRETVSSFPYLDELEYYFSEAYNKYQEMQKSV